MQEMEMWRLGWTTPWSSWTPVSTPMAGTAMWLSKTRLLDSPNVNPGTVEHDEPWPGGRSNHYMFDMNRDWAWQTQVETQGRVTAYRRWLPQVHVDFHEQGVNSPYYFRPRSGALPQDHQPLAAQVPGAHWGQQRPLVRCPWGIVFHP